MTGAHIDVQYGEQRWAVANYFNIGPDAVTTAHAQRYDELEAEGRLDG